MIKAIFFDFDGVLTPVNSGRLAVAQSLHRIIPALSQQRFMECINPYRTDLYTGKLDQADIWDEFTACVGVSISLAQLEQAFLDTPKNEAILRLAESLKNKYFLGIITDNSKRRFSLLEKHWQLSSIFSAIILSADIGADKRSPIPFHKALEIARIPAAECIFIDNKQLLLEVPKSLGMKTYYFDTEKNDVAALVEQLQAWGVEIDKELQKK